MKIEGSCRIAHPIITRGGFDLRALVTAIACAAAACSMASGTSFALFGPEAPSEASQSPLTFAERVVYQRAIEEVYWRHRIWPKERPDPKPSLDAVMSQAQLEKKVADYLRKSQALEDYWQQPITAEQLQAEMDRMAQHTKQPDVLHELFEALGNDPVVIAECLARPALSERLLTNSSAYDQRFSAEASSLTPAASGSYTLPIISDGPNGCIDNTWTPTRTTSAPSARAVHTAIWTGSEMIVWGGADDVVGLTNTGGRYNPATDSWTATSTSNAPTGRDYHTAVWTGSEMIVWGGLDDHGYVNTGGRYDPSTNSWTATTIFNAPVGRASHTAVWSGNEMIVWGGGTNFLFNTGGRYNPGTNSWATTSIANAPAGRTLHTAVWTGSEMIVWGGTEGNGYVNTGGRYNPSTDSWTATSITNAPSARTCPSVWTGSEMIVWGGWGNLGLLNTGGRYNPNTDGWATTSITNAPSARGDHTAAWTGSEMIVWSGYDVGGFTNTGGRYNPGTESWTVTSTTNAPTGRDGHTTVWTGSEMIVWGGSDRIGPPPPSLLNTGGRYCAQSGPTPTPTPTPCTVWKERSSVPYSAAGIFAASDGTFVYAGGGNFGVNLYNDLFRYDPDADTWTPLAPSADAHTGSQAVYFEGKIYNMGGVGCGPNLGCTTDLTRIYDIATNSWTTGAPMPQPLADMATVVWNGVIYVAGGVGGDWVDTLYAYDIASDTWSTLTPMPQALSDPGFGIIDGKLYVAGGSNVAPVLNTLYIYDMATNTWSPGSDLPQAVRAPGSAVLNGQLYLFGGIALVEGVYMPVATTQVYDPASNTWSMGPDMNVTRSGFYGTAVGNASIVAPGGSNGGILGLNDNEQLINTPCATPTPTVTPTPTLTPTPTPRPSPTTRPRPTAYPRPTP